MQPERLRYYLRFGKNSHGATAHGGIGEFAKAAPPVSCRGHCRGQAENIYYRLKIGPLDTAAARVAQLMRTLLLSVCLMATAAAAQGVPTGRSSPSLVYCLRIAVSVGVPALAGIAA